MSDRSTRKVAESADRISLIEVVSYTAAIALIAAMALGFFDAMVPWR
jgi:hypothetical protein